MYIYLPLTKKKASLLFSKKSIKRNHKVILDLEDSAMDISSDSKTLELKSLARDGMQFVLERFSDEERRNTFIRINDPKSPFFKKDIIQLKNSNETGSSPYGIFLPKLESENDMKLLLDEFYKNNLNHLKIVVMIETEMGFKFIENLRKEISTQIYGIHYGQFDYCLDQSYWPFEEYGSAIYWMNTGRIISSILSNNLKLFVQTPFNRLTPDIDAFKNSYSNLKNLVKGRFEFDLSVLGYDCLIDNKNLLQDEELKSKKSMAIDIIRQFDLARASSRSFASIAGKFVPPHEFISAQKYIASLEE